MVGERRLVRTALVAFVASRLITALSIALLGCLIALLVLRVDFALA